MAQNYSIQMATGYAAISFYDVPSDLIFLRDIFNKLADEEIIVDMISMTPPCGSNIKLTFTVFDSDIVKTSLIISSLKNKYTFLRPIISIGNCKVIIKEDLMKEQSGIAAKALRCLISENVELMLITTSENDISFLTTITQGQIAYNILEKNFLQS